MSQARSYLQSTSRRITWSVKFAASRYAPLGDHASSVSKFTSYLSTGGSYNGSRNGPRSAPLEALHIRITSGMSAVAKRFLSGDQVRAVILPLGVPTSMERTNVQ